MKHLLLPILLSCLFMVTSCNSQPRIDLAKLAFNEPIENVIVFNDSTLSVGVATFRVPDALAIEKNKCNDYSFNGIPLDSAKVYFKVHSPEAIKEIVKSMKDGGAHLNMYSGVKDITQLKKILQAYQADDAVYACAIYLRTQDLDKLKQALVLLYGKGTTNPNSKNSLYWNVPAENKFIFFNPELECLTIVNNTTVPKTGYSDATTGWIDFGGGDPNRYFEEIYGITQKALVDSMKEPLEGKITHLYNIDFSASVCRFEIKVNGHPVLNMDVEGQTSTMFTIDENIVKSGEQQIEIIMLPLPGKTQIDANAEFKYKLYLFDTNGEKSKFKAQLLEVESVAADSAAVKTPSKITLSKLFTGDK